MVDDVMTVRILLVRLRCYLAADPGRFAGGTVVNGPAGLLAVEAERRAAASRRPGRLAGSS
jgi:hypothetical protein